MTGNDFHHTVSPGLGTHSTSFTIAAFTTFTTFTTAVAILGAVSTSFALGIRGISQAVFLQFLLHNQSTSAGNLFGIWNRMDQLSKDCFTEVNWSTQKMQKPSGNSKSVVVTYTISNMFLQTNHKHVHLIQKNELGSCFFPVFVLGIFSPLTISKIRLMRSCAWRHDTLQQPLHQKKHVPCLTLLVWRLHWNSPAPSAAQPWKSAVWRASQGKG